MEKRKLKFELDHKLYVRLRENYKDGDKWKSKYYSTGIQLKRKSDWNPLKQKVKSTDPQYILLNTELDGFLNTIINKKKETKQAQYDKEHSFLSYMETYIGKELNYSTRVKFNTIQVWLNRYLKTLNKSDLFFEEINKEFVEGYKKYVEDTPNQYKRRSEQHSTDKYFQMFRRICKDIQDNEIFIFPRNTFTNIKLTETHGKKKRLNKEEYNDLLNISKNNIYKAFSKLDESSEKINQKIDTIILSRNKFVCQIMFGGTRVKDFLTIKWKNFSSHKEFIALSYTASKTEINMEIALPEKIIKYLKPSVLKACEKVNYFGNDLIKQYTETLISIDKEYEKLEKVKLAKKVLGVSDYVIDLQKEVNQLNKKESKVKNISVEDKKYILDKAFQIESKIDIVKLIETERKIFTYLINTLIKEPTTNNRLIFFEKENDNEIFKNYSAKINVEEQEKRIHALTATTNKKLKLLQDYLKLNFPLSSHTAKHTSSQILISKGITIHELMKIKGHKKLQTTHNYIEDMKSLDASDRAKDMY